jgi:hypothetical protein
MMAIIAKYDLRHFLHKALLSANKSDFYLFNAHRNQLL